MKNLKKYKDSLIAKAVPVPATANAGDVVPLGADGLLGVLKTARATTATILAGTAAPGLANGEATVIVLKVTLILELTLATAANQFAKIYRKTSDGSYTTDSTGAVAIGYAAATIAAPGKVDVFITG